MVLLTSTSRLHRVRGEESLDLARGESGLCSYDGLLTFPTNTVPTSEGYTKVRVEIFLDCACGAARRLLTQIPFYSWILLLLDLPI